MTVTGQSTLNINENNDFTEVFKETLDASYKPTSRRTVMTKIHYLYEKILYSYFILCMVRPVLMYIFLSVLNTLISCISQ